MEEDLAYLVMENLGVSTISIEIPGYMIDRDAAIKI